MCTQALLLKVMMLPLMVDLYGAKHHTLSACTQQHLIPTAAMPSTVILDSSQHSLAQDSQTLVALSIELAVQKILFARTHVRTQTMRELPQSCTVNWPIFLNWPQSEITGELHCQSCTPQHNMVIRGTEHWIGPVSVFELAV